MKSQFLFFLFICFILVSLNRSSPKGLELKKTEFLMLNYCSNLVSSDTAKLIFNFQKKDTIKVFFLEPVELSEVSSYSEESYNIVCTFHEIAECNQYEKLYLCNVGKKHYIVYPDYFLLSKRVKMAKSIQKLSDTLFEIIPLDTLNFEKVESWILVKE